MRVFGLIVGCALGLAAACGSSDESASTHEKTDASTDARDSSDALPQDATSPDTSVEDASPPDAQSGDSQTPDADAGSEPPCKTKPCAARPIIFVHGFQGSWDDFITLMEGLVVYDGRWDSFTVSGNEDAKAWAPGTFGRRQWLFSFDFYLSKAADKPGSYSAGPGRIGSNDQFACSSPAGAGHILGDNAAYDDGYSHEYARDLAEFVERVRTATGAKDVDLVGHSMGGMIVRSYLAYHGGSAITEHALLLSSPIRGVSLIGFLQLFPVSGPSWQAMHEVAELDGGSLLSKVRFSRCGEATTDKGAFGQKLLDDELASPPTTTLYVLSGGSDFEVSYDIADHPLEAWHEVIDGASHSGILTAEATRTRLAQVLGGTY